eukprot:TRINITY_DN1263_c0_g1_i11.p1 TRINITY_DN1263_c0_g1~~TRINITY_DN1263_c0_g1_i11.p1  ORF type:complete len:165 (-),score=8.81 TRINITY_DN1263_c0_g1_i11:580-1074(-)
MSTCGFILPTLDYIIEASKTSKKEMPSTSSKQKMQAVTNRIQARYEHYLAHEGGWLAAATVLTPIFHANEVPKKVKSFVPVVQKVKKAAAAFLKKEGGVQLSACLIEFLGKVDPFADEEFWYLAAKKNAVHMVAPHRAGLTTQLRGVKTLVYAMSPQPRNNTQL